MGKKKSNKNKKNLKKKNKANNTNIDNDNNNNTTVDNVMASLENVSISALDAQPDTENRQPSSDPYPFVGTFTSAVFGRATGRPPIEPGRTARVVGLVNRRDLNGEHVNIKNILDNGRIECEIIHLESTDYETRESIAIRPQNLEVNYNVTSTEWGQGIEECPICLDTKMDTTTNASLMECW